jgi:hypothetical protein
VGACVVLRGGDLLVDLGGILRLERPQPIQ